jgi:hypothetical protein
MAAHFQRKTPGALVARAFHIVAMQQKRQPVSTLQKQNVSR